ncbi:hypothetical protein Godav_001241 [Gossypium davidsonii]|uniref:Uncharacterized protein n=1 Tax=Gossypium davidsonii TaxID=34287 RepID=A0A7J8T396_GOSDV|nr:hypothetical protein [Gossypium davidsonii]
MTMRRWCWKSPLLRSLSQVLTFVWWVVFFTTSVI